jgi:hypothetical protein
MSKAMLEFDLDEYSDKLEHVRAVNATNAYLALLSIGELFSYMIKREMFNGKELNQVEYDLVDKLQDKVADIINDYVNMDDLE